MKAYELMLVLNASLEEEPRAAVLERVSGIVGTDGGVVDSVDEWGKRRLTYEIAGQTDGDYVVVSFHTTPAAIAELDRVLHITDPVVRYMIVRRDDLS